MDSNPNNEALKSGRIEATEDVEGHMPYRKVDGEPDPQDVDGHGFRGNVETDEGDDTEGHGLRRGIVEDDDDAEGHGVRVRFVETPEVSDEDGDDIEGHGVRIEI